jgi:hypothetical protein
MGGVGGAVGKVRERFQLDVSEEEAVRLLDQIIVDSVNAVFGGGHGGGAGAGPPPAGERHGSLRRTAAWPRARGRTGGGR